MLFDSDAPKNYKGGRLAPASTISLVPHNTFKTITKRTHREYHIILMFALVSVC
jgi:hypothetical protein